MLISLTILEPGCGERRHVEEIANGAHNITAVVVEKRDSDRIVALY
jgi:hypothetical protein